MFPVGRLDADTEGLLLLTNDGELAHRLTHPRYGVEKEYLAEVDGGHVAPGALRRLREGVELDDGRTAPATVSQPSPGRAAHRRSTRAATARCGGCARRSATRCTGWCAPASARSATAGSRRARGGRSRPTRCAASPSPPRAAGTIAPRDGVPRPRHELPRSGGRSSAGASSLARSIGSLDEPGAPRVNVIGLGLIGGSIALGLRDAGWDVSGDDIKADRAERRVGAAASTPSASTPTPRITFVAVPVLAVADQVERALAETAAWSPTSAA